MGQFIDLTGQRFGRLLVTQRAEPRKGYHGAMWLCQCDCGQASIVNAQNLKSGNTTSCGCYGAERRVNSVKSHGQTGTRLHRIWKAMHTRCYNTNSPQFEYYGYRGIFICDAWKVNFKAFYDWAMANGYRDDLTIDRIDNDKGYSPDNCRWTTMEEQNKNKRAENGYKAKEI